MLQEGNQTGGDRDNLLGRHVHELHRGGIHLDEFAVLTGCDTLAGEVAAAVVVIDGVVSLGNEVVFFLISGEVYHFVGHDGLHALHLALLVLLLHVLHAAERSLDETVLIDSGVGAQGVNQTDIRTFGGLNRADSAIVGRMHVSHLETGTVAVQTTRAQSRQTTLVGQLCQRVNLVHELGELAAAEEVAHHGAEGLRVDELAGGDIAAGGIAQGHALLHQTLGAGKTHAALVGDKLTHGAHAAVAQVVNIIHLTFTMSQAQQVLKGSQEVHRLDEAAILRHVQTELLVDLVAAHAGQVVALLILEQAVKSGGCLLHGRRITRAELAENLLEG